MRKITNINQDWTFIKDGEVQQVSLPHTWNAVDGMGGQKAITEAVAFMKK